MGHRRAGSVQPGAGDGRVVIRVSPKITAGSREQLARTLKTAAYRRTFRAAGVMRELCESNVRDVIRERFVTDRPTHRRRFPGGPRLINSFEAVIEGPRDEFPIVVTIQPIARVRNNPEFLAKTISLVKGSRPHDIPPSRGFLVFPWAGYSGRTALGSAKRNFEAYGRPNIRTRRTVHHPGTRSEDVLEEAARRSLAQLRGRV